jgi:hypothetical protein
MTRRDERTSARVARIAARVLACKPDCAVAPLSPDDFGFIDADSKWHQFKWSDIRALAASALTQAPSKPVPPRAHADIEWNKPAAKNHKPIARKIALRSKRGGKGFSA